MSFVFVDRISAITAASARGELRRAPDAPPLPPWLVIEAVGQLAARIAMARGNFATRPVAALVGEVHLIGAAVGGTLALEARIDRLDSRAVLYSGSARVCDREIAALRRCVGPLLPAHTFDDPGALRQRFAALCAGPLPPGAGGAEGALPGAELSDLALADGTATALLRIPAAAPFFADHFPRRPVYPAALLADAQSQSPRRWRRRLSALHRRSAADVRRRFQGARVLAAGPGVGPRRRDATIRGRHGGHRRLGPRGGQTHRDRRTRVPRRNAAMSATAPRPGAPLRSTPARAGQGRNWLGDLVMSLPALKAVRRAFPAARLSVLIKAELASFFDGAGWIDEYPVPRRPLARRSRQPPPRRGGDPLAPLRSGHRLPAQLRVGLLDRAGARAEAASASPPTAAA